MLYYEYIMHKKHLTSKELWTSVKAKMKEDSHLVKVAKEGLNTNSTNSTNSTYEKNISNISNISF